MPFLHARRDLDGDLAIVDLQSHLAAERRGDKGNGDLGRVLGLGFRAAGSTLACAAAAKDALKVCGSAGAATAKHVAKHLRRLLRIDLLKTRSASPMKMGVAETARATLRPGVRAGFAETVVLAALRLVAQDIVGRLHFLELPLGLLVAGVAIRMILPGQLAVSLLDLVLGGVAFDSQGLVIIAGHE